MTIVTDHNIGDRVSHSDYGIGTVERIEADVNNPVDAGRVDSDGKPAPVIMYHIKFENGETIIYDEVHIDAVD